MGRVTFNGNVATSESMVLIRTGELKILQSEWDEYTKARKIEQWYQEHGLIPYTNLRAGSDQAPGDKPDIPFRVWGPIRQGIGWVGGFILCLIALRLMELWGH